MTDFEYISDMLSTEFLRKPPHHLTMIEEKETNGLPPQSVEIKFVPNQIEKVGLYRFDAEEKEFLPFFNNANGAPKDLRSFCDYIILVECDGQLTIFLIEMKRDTTSGHEDQLNAGKEFVSYLLNSAMRIREQNHYEFDKKNVNIRRVLIKEEKSNKNLTKPKDIYYKNKNDIISYKCHNEFRIRDLI